MSDDVQYVITIGSGGAVELDKIVSDSGVNVSEVIRCAMISLACDYIHNPSITVKYIRDMTKLLKKEKQMRFKYLRSERNENPAGCIAFKTDNRTGKISYQISVLNPKPDDSKKRDIFNRKCARSLSEERLNTSPFVIDAPVVSAMKDRKSWTALQTVMNHMVGNRELPTRARKVAKKWLKSNLSKPANGHMNDDSLLRDFINLCKRFRRAAKRWIKSNLISL